MQGHPMLTVTLPPELAHPAEAADSGGLQRLSEFERQSPPQAGDAHAGHTRLAGLNPSVLQDLQGSDAGARAEAGAGTRNGRIEGLDLMEVLAAALRHNRALQLHLELDYRVIPLAVWPQARVVQSPLDGAQLLNLRLPDLHVLLVEPARTVPPAGGTVASPLGVLLWELALRGARGTLLAPISGPAAYRVAPGVDLQALGLSGTLAAAVERLRHTGTPLRDIAGWPGFDHDRACRLLNGLYLQAALIVSRSHPAAAAA
jgi:hypothetical protein